jgi:hypothetical protein
MEQFHEFRKYFHGNRDFHGNSGNISMEIFNGIPWKKKIPWSFDMNNSFLKKNLLLKTYYNADVVINKR